MELGLPPQPCTTQRRRENFLLLPGIEPRFLSHPYSSVVTILTTLFSPPPSLPPYIYIYIHTHTHIYYIYIHIQRQTGGRSDGQKDRETDRQADRWIDTQIGRQIYRYTDKQTGRQTERQTDKRMDGWMDRQVGRQMDGQIDSKVKLMTIPLNYYTSQYRTMVVYSSHSNIPSICFDFIRPLPPPVVCSFYHTYTVLLAITMLP